MTNTIVHLPNSCTKCKGYTILVKEEFYISKSCIMCGKMEFFNTFTPIKLKSIEKTLICEYCNINEYVKKLKSLLKTCGYCYLKLLYESPKDIILSKNNYSEESKKRISEMILENLKGFKKSNNGQKIEDYIFENLESKKFDNVRELIIHCSKKSGLSYYNIKNILIAKQDVNDINMVNGGN